MSKKALTILILFILVIGGIAAFLYFLLIGSSPTLPDLNQYKPTASGDLFPFSSPDPARPLEQPPINTTSGTSTSGVVTTLSTSRLQRISSEPIAGAMASSTASTTIIRYVDRGTGHVIEKIMGEGQGTISNTTIPRVYEALWNKKGDSFLMRYPTEEGNGINTFLATLFKTSSSASTTLTNTTYDLRASYISDKIKSIALSPKRDRIFYTISVAEGIRGYTADFNDTNIKQIWESPLTSWQVEWPEENTLSVTTAASGFANGFNYFVNARTGAVTKNLGPIRGLTTLTSTDGRKILYSQNSGRGIATFIYDVRNARVSDAPFRTLAEKCVWSNLNKNNVYCAVPTEVKNGNYPDDWYKGKTLFIDQLWYINTETGESKLLANPFNELKATIDATNLTFDNLEKVLLFTNKYDLSLWALDLNK